MTTILDFEDLQELDFVTNNYLSRGVIILGGATAHRQPAMAHSGSTYLSPLRHQSLLPIPPLDYFFAEFQPRSQKRVALYAGTEGGNPSSVFGVLRAYASNGAEIAHDGIRQVQPGACATRFEVSTPGNDIAQIEMQMFGFDGMTANAFDPDQAIDDLEFEADPIPIMVAPVRYITLEPYIYNRWWRIETHGGLTPPGPPPIREAWLRSFAAALVLSNTAQMVAEELRKHVHEIASKQGLIAADAIKREMTLEKKR